MTTLFMTTTEAQTDNYPARKTVDTQTESSNGQRARLEEVVAPLNDITPLNDIIPLNDIKKTS